MGIFLFQVQLSFHCPVNPHTSKRRSLELYFRAHAEIMEEDKHVGSKA